MQAMLKFDDQTRAVAMATGGGAIAAIVAMFVPTGIWETLTGSTGVSELIPATAAPLGDTARALISYGFGALTLLILAALLLRRTGPADLAAISHDEPLWTNPEVFGDDEDSFEEEGPRVSLFARIKAWFAAFVAARRNGDGINDLADLPKLRAGDAHPDAPPRRPFSAQRDIAEAEAYFAEPTEVEAVEVEAEWVEAEEVETVEVMQPAAESAEAPVAVTQGDANSLDEMVRRFETALAERDAQLAFIEKLASELPSNVQPIRPDISPAAEIEPVAIEPAPLRAVEAEEAPADVPPRPESEELDAALRSALETLHRMNARNR
jgi:hypothetical protein